jgi:flagellar biosynthesis protein FlhF
MQIKRFEAKNMTAALRLIKAELGSEAVILSARSLKKGSGILSSFKPVGVEVTAATDTYALTSPTSTRESRIKQYAYSPVGGANTYPVALKKRPVPGANSLKRRYMATNAYADERHGDLSAEKKILFSLYQQLVSQDVDPDIATDITESLKLIPDASHRLAQGELKSLLVGILEHMGVIAKPIEFESTRARAVAFIGTTGVGKTTTIAKLAAHFAIDQNKDVAMITLDDLRIAAIDQIKACANIIGIPLEVASNGVELKKHIKRNRRKDLILIDTPGFNPKNIDQIMDLQRYFKKLNNIETQLVLSATTKEKDLLDTVKRFENIGTNHLTFTRIDESNTVGNLLNVLIRTTIPFSYLADGQQIPNAIQDASIEDLATLLLRREAGSDIWPDTRQSAAQHHMADPNEKFTEPVRNMRFVANRNSDVYHVAGCKWTKKIKPDHIVTFENALGAQQQNYLPCRNCNPHRADMRSMEFSDGDRMKVSTDIA